MVFVGWFEPDDGNLEVLASGGEATGHSVSVEGLLVSVPSSLDLAPPPSRHHNPALHFRPDFRKKQPRGDLVGPKGHPWGSTPYSP